jgi:V-type H+-transporting ATPase subunit a
MAHHSGPASTHLIWVPLYQEARFTTHINDLCQNAGRALQISIQNRAIDEELTVPTCFRATQFSDVFQQIVDTYGVPNYKEANPALLTGVTFPFLFGVMFGDVMHGGLLLGFALWIYWAGQKRVDSLTPYLWPIKHFLLLMGFFATFCGFCYNDYSSVALYTFGRSCYELQPNGPGSQIGVQKEGCVYPFGIDPTWYLSTSELTYMNSVKMKLSVIFGVWQMSIGICLKGSNNLYYGNWVDFLFEFLPQIIVMLCMFGYMDLLIVWKWLTNWEGRTSNSPSIISTMIDMFLNGGKPTVESDLPIIGTWKEQTEIENILMYIVLICIPLMLFVKPVFVALGGKKKHHAASTDEIVKIAIIHALGEEPNFKEDDDSFKQPFERITVDQIQFKEKFARYRELENALDDAYNSYGGLRLSRKQAQDYVDCYMMWKDRDFKQLIVNSAGDQGHAVHDFGELMIHQLIETIEFILGTVSNTASYLRLWALSLAHSQLAKVFFDNCLNGGFQSGSVIALYFGFFVFIMATFGVLMCMDLLECSLHTLRLHWVEF